MAEIEPRRSSRVRKPTQRFEDTVYAADILYTHLRDAAGGGDAAEFLSALFTFYRPACHDPSAWNGSRPSKVRAAYRLVRDFVVPLQIDAAQLMEFAHHYSTGDLVKDNLRNALRNSQLDRGALKEFEATIGVAGRGEEGEEGAEDDEDDEEMGSGDNDAEDEDESYANDEDEDDEDDEEPDEDDEDENEDDVEIETRRMDDENPSD